MGVDETVTPAKAGVHGRLWRTAGTTRIHSWIPACAGMTDRGRLHRNRKTMELDIQLQQLIVQVLPFRICFLNEANFPSAFPLLYGFLACNSNIHRTAHFVPD